MLVTERTETLKLMDELESLVMKEGWPVPFSGYYLVHHERMFTVLDRLRTSLQDDLDERFLQVFSHQGCLQDDVRASAPDEERETVLVANGKGTQA